MGFLRSFCRVLPPWGIMLTVGLLATAINGLLVTLNPPVPRVHDEFSYLLAADTYAAGRLTNPTHPHWPHFETMHVIQRPSYASKYPPGQGLLLASGRLVAGHPLATVCLSTGVAAAACVWMLLAFMPTRWAAFGGMIVALHSGIQLQWGMSYWGGALALAAGATLIGSAARLARQPAWLTGPSLAFATAACTLAITRPFEGFLLVVGSSLVVASAWLRSKETNWRRLAIRSLAPIALVGAAGAAGLLAYNHAVTGAALRMPYQVHEGEYGATPLFVWQTPDKGIAYRHDPLRRYHLAASMWWFDQQQTWFGFAKLKAWLSRCSLEFFLPAPIALALLATGWARRRSLWPWLALGLAVWLAACGAVWMFPHYLAPIAPLLLLMIVAGARSFRTLERRLPPTRRWITPSLLMLQGLLFAFAAYDRVSLPPTTWAHARQAFAEKLRKEPGDDLVFVRYAPDHNVHNEWVYNGADVDGSPVVWAREIDPTADRQLIEAFGERNVWLVLADAKPVQLVRYPIAQSEGEAETLAASDR